MRPSVETVTAVPILVLLATAVSLAVLALQISISHIQVALVYVSLAFFFSGLVLTISWFNYWRIHREFQDEMHTHAA
jgi:hypothetical protein